MKSSDGKDIKSMCQKSSIDTIAVNCGQHENLRTHCFGSLKDVKTTMITVAKPNSKKTTKRVLLSPPDKNAYDKLIAAIENINGNYEILDCHGNLIPVSM